MSLQLVTPPAAEPLTLGEAKAHLKVDTTADDALIASLIVAARTRAEWLSHRALITQSWIFWRDGWPCEGFEIPLPPFQSLTSISAYDLNDTATVLELSFYRLDAAAVPARIGWREAVVPPPSLRSFNTLAVAFTCGYGDAAADVPEPIRRALLAIVADLYTHRGDEAPTPTAALALLEPYRVMQL